ncbi:hypothetical protein CCHR01_03984 [Colletotrichum chrysophilum]|uniref:Uncharacterized protein n=1 Tax=Colletotrichum chrysophilum TaxID=1836956 RepID=A0AAD9AU80_9PEZI|nr:hypothetical protein CCHR01_03984 [Colletotrichum chrysophilum]
MGERTGSRVFQWVWSYVTFGSSRALYIPRKCACEAYFAWGWLRKRASQLPSKQAGLQPMTRIQNFSALRTGTRNVFRAKSHSLESSVAIQSGNKGTLGVNYKEAHMLGTKLVRRALN